MSTLQVHVCGPNSFISLGALLGLLDGGWGTGSFTDLQVLTSPSSAMMDPVLVMHLHRYQLFLLQILGVILCTRTGSRAHRGVWQRFSPSIDQALGFSQWLRFLIMAGQNETRNDTMGRHPIFNEGQSKGQLKSLALIRFCM